MGTITPAELVEESLGFSGCRRWLAVIGLLDSYVDAEQILVFSMVCRKLQSLRWTLKNQNWGCGPLWGGQLRSPEQPNGPKLVSFAAFRGADGAAIVERYVREVINLLELSTGDGLVVDLSHCVLIKDKDLIELVSNDSPFVQKAGPAAGGGGGKSTSRTSRKGKSKSKVRLVGLKLDYCSALTDQALAALLSTYLPHLQLIAFKCIRNKQFTGEPFVQLLTYHSWPSIRYINLDFTSATLASVQATAQLLNNPVLPSNWPNADALDLTPASFGSSNLPSSSPAAAGHELSSPCSAGEDAGMPPGSRSEQPSTGFSSVALIHSSPVSPWLSFVGSQASKAFIESIGAKHLIARLQEALNSADPDELRALKTAADTESLILDHADILAEHVVDRGGAYIMNLPVTCPTSEEGGVNVWTLPISLAMLNGDALFVQTLIECGAEIDVVDHLGKSPLYRAVSTGNIEVVEYLVGHGVELAPLNITCPTAMNAAVMTRNYEIARLLIEHGYPLNLKCPGFKTFKSPLHAAAELPDERLLHDFLDWGADPNTYCGSAKNSAIMLAYKAEPRLLRLFIHNLRFKSKPLAAEVLAAAIAKDDLRTVELIIETFPTLLEREHATWSYPHIQASKTGRSAILLCLFRTFTLRIVGADLKDLRRTFPLCMKHCQDELNNSDAANAPTPGVGMFPNSSPAKVSRLPSKGSGDESHPLVGNGADNVARGSTVNPRTRIRFWSKQSTAEAQSLRLLPMESDEAALQHWNESIANSYNKSGQLPARYSQFLNAVDQNTGNTALHYAAESGHLECVKLLLRYGCDVDLQNYHMQTPLHIACHENQLEIAEYLLCTGADFLELSDEENQTALVTAIHTRNDRISSAILQFWRMCRRQGVELVHQAASETEDLTNDSLQYLTGPLDVAVEYGRWEIVGQLLKVGHIKELLSSSAEKQDKTYELVQQALQNPSTKLSPQSRKTLSRFITLYDAAFRSGDAAQPDPVSEPDSEEDLGADWYDLCLLCGGTTKGNPQRTETPPAPGPQMGAATTTMENRDSRARRFQSKLKLVARKPLLLFTSTRHKTLES